MVPGRCRRTAEDLTGVQYLLSLGAAGASALQYQASALRTIRPMRRPYSSPRPDAPRYRTGRLEARSTGDSDPPQLRAGSKKMGPSAAPRRRRSRARRALQPVVACEWEYPRVVFGGPDCNANATREWLACVLHVATQKVGESRSRVTFRGACKWVISKNN